MSAQYFRGTRLVGTGPYSPRWSTSTAPGQFSYAYFCPTCGDIWARIATDRPWFAVTRGCQAHPYPHTDQPGGLWLPPWPTEILDYPVEVLREEFLANYAHWAKEQT
jgi:hypothetical protein